MDPRIVQVLSRRATPPPSESGPGLTAWGRERTVPPERSSTTRTAALDSRRFHRPENQRLETRSVISATQALDAAYAGEVCELIRADGSTKLVAVHRWDRTACETDLRLFVDPCTGPTLDVGCGPGRLTGALTARGVSTLGIDISPQAVRQARGRGGAALCQDIFDPLPGSDTWQHILLADGNIGLGGHPIRLLRRVAELLGPDGTVLVELAGPGVGRVHAQVRLRVGQRVSRPFSWATVGLEGIDQVAKAAGLMVTDRRCMTERQVATLKHQRSAPARMGP